MADKVEINESGVIEDKPKRNNAIWFFVIAALVFIAIFLYFLSSVFSSKPNGAANSSNSTQTIQSTH